MEDWCEEIAKSPDALEYDLRSRVSGVNGAAIQFFPSERYGDRRVRRAGTQGVGGRRVAADIVLCSVNRDATSPVGRTGSQGNQLRVRCGELSSYRFDPGADALEGILRGSRHVDMQTASAAGLRISPDSCLFELIMKPQRSLPNLMKRGRLAGIQFKKGTRATSPDSP